MKFEVTILGSNSATPAHGRHPTSQFLNIRHQHFMIDCGEGTQIRLTALGVKRSKINQIFISHLHGDHYFGLIGLLTSYHLGGRTAELNVYGPPLLKEVIDIQLKAGETTLNYPLNFHPVAADKPAIIYENNKLTVETIILSHRIPCTGFLFREKPDIRSIIPEKIKELNIPFGQINEIKAGADFTDAEGTTHPNETITTDPLPPRSYAYCSDTCFKPGNIPQLKGVDLLYHEATFDNESRERATKTFHSTAEDAATMARDAQVKRLIIGHFSTKYRDLRHLHNEAKAVFPNTELALEGRRFSVERFPK